MKLRNKKTGEIRNAEDVIIENLKKNGSTLNAISIDEIRNEWEDYEEPKEHSFYNFTPALLDNRKVVLIVDEKATREEAEKAVEKLKAWKRLKDKGFRFALLEYTLDEDIDVYGSVRFVFLHYEKCNKDIELLFGDEE